MGVDAVYEKDKWGNEEWRVNGKLHRTDGPAVINAFGEQYWYNNGLKHRTDGPALITISNEQVWFINDRDITSEVEEWMKLKEITWPFDELTKVEFLLTWA